MKKELLCKIERIAARAVKKAQQENHRKGLPIVYAKNGKIYFELSDGSVTTVNPFSV
ncbi:MAG: hypothetical protein PHX21_06790 [bacterium]|nr:hypothetical protein [bacterium]